MELEEDNPFADPSALGLLTNPTPKSPTDTRPPTKTKQKEPPPEQQRLLSPAGEPTPSSSAYDSAAVDDAELREREENVTKRELELQKKEASFDHDIRPKNFPPLPKCCPCQPCFHVNIMNEIPESERWKVFSLLVLLITYVLLLFLNIVVSLAGLIIAIKSKTEYSSTSAIIALVLGTTWLFVFTTLALFCWFMPAYTAYRRNNSMMFMFFFFVMVFQCIFWIVFALGPPGFSSGIISGVQLLSANKAVGAMFLVMGFLWMILVPWGGLLTFLIHRYYRSSGGTVDKALGEAAKEAASSKYLKDAVKTGVKAATSSE